MSFLVACNGTGKLTTTFKSFKLYLTYSQSFIQHVLAYFAPPTNPTAPELDNGVQRPLPLLLTHIPVYGENGELSTCSIHLCVANWAIR